MSQHLVLVGSGILLVLSAILGLAWWVVIVQSGAIHEAPHEAFPFMVAFFAAQVVGWCLVGGLLRRVSRFWSPGWGAVLLFLTLLLLLGNGLFYFTPVVGSPLLVLACLVAGATLIVTRRNREAKDNV